MKQLFFLVLLTTGMLLIRAGYEFYAKQIKVNLEIGKRFSCHHAWAVFIYQEGTKTARCGLGSYVP